MQGYGVWQEKVREMDEIEYTGRYYHGPHSLAGDGHDINNVRNCIGKHCETHIVTFPNVPSQILGAEHLGKPCTAPAKLYQLVYMSCRKYLI